MRNSIDWSEFLKNEAGKESADRLLLLASFPFATSLSLYIGTTEALGVYLASYGILAGNNKWASRNANTHMDSKQLAATSDSDTVSASSTTSTVVAQRSVKSTKPKRRSF
jgi:hypothetical protein